MGVFGGSRYAPPVLPSDCDDIVSTSSPSGLNFKFCFVDDKNRNFRKLGWIDNKSEEPTVIQGYFLRAGMSWGEIIDSSEQVAVLVRSDSTIPRSGGLSVHGLRVGEDDDGRSIYEPSSVTKSRTGYGVNNYEIILDFNTEYVRNYYWVDPTTPTPSDKTDFHWIVSHELGHGLGVSGTRDTKDGSLLDPNSISTFDALTTFDGIRAFYTGGKTTSYYGSSFPIAYYKYPDDSFYTQNFYHFGDHSTLDLHNTLMTGSYAPTGTSLEPYSELSSYQTCFDIAVMIDLGYKIDFDAHCLCQGNGSVLSNRPGSRSICCTNADCASGKCGLAPSRYCAPGGSTIPIDNNTGDCSTENECSNIFTQQSCTIFGTNTTGSCHIIRDIDACTAETRPETGVCV